MHQKKPPIPHNAQVGIQIFLTMFNLISLEISLSEENHQMSF